MMKFILLILMNLSIIILFMNHPLAISIILLTQILLISILMIILMKLSWFSYIIFLIMIGGLLIIFSYMTSIASNEKFNFNNKVNLIIMMMIMNFTLIIKINNWEINELKMNLLFSKYFSYPLNLLIIFLFIYLFITLIACVKITNYEKGPLRQKI